MRAMPQPAKRAFGVEPGKDGAIVDCCIRERIFVFAFVDAPALCFASSRLFAVALHQKMLAGCLSGGLSAAVCTPADVVKARARAPVSPPVLA